MRALRAFKTLLFLLLLAAAGLLLYAYMRDNPQDMPWTALDLGDPVGVFTGRKLAGLTEDGERCRGLLDKAGIAYEARSPVENGPHCSVPDGIRLDTGEGPQNIGYSPPSLSMSCPVAAALAVWEWNIVQPAALDLFGQDVARIEHFGSYGCRRIGGGTTGDWSEHATADAIDIAAFILEDGTRISLVRDWQGAGAKPVFLRRIRDGACALFSTVLSPDYNAAHADHFHFDQAERGAYGWRRCR